MVSYLEFWLLLQLELSLNYQQQRLGTLGGPQVITPGNVYIYAWRHLTAINFIV